MLDKPGDLAGLLTNLNPGDVLFIDEIHRLSPIVEEYLYSAMEDYKIDIVLDKGPSARSIQIELAPFTLIGATTRSGLLTSPLRARFGIQCHLEYYDAAVLCGDRAAFGAHSRRLDRRRRGPRGRPAVRAAPPVSPTPCCAACATSPWSRARGTSTCRSRAWRSRRSTSTARGLDHMDNQHPPDDHRASSTAAPSGLNTIATAVGEDAGTIEEVYEPFLIKEGFLKRTPRGREATPLAWEHLGYGAPGGGDATLF